MSPMLIKFLWVIAKMLLFLIVYQKNLIDSEFRSELSQKIRCSAAIFYIRCMIFKKMLQIHTRLSLPLSKAVCVRSSHPQGQKVQT